MCNMVAEVCVCRFQLLLYVVLTVSIMDIGEYNKYVDKVLNRIPSVDTSFGCYLAG